MAEDPKNDRARYYLASSYEDMEELDKAIDEFLKIGPDSDLYPDARLHLAYLLSRKEKYARAAELVKEAIAIVPNKPALYLSLGSLYEAMDNFDQARDALLAGLSRDEEDPEMHFRLGVVLDKLGDKEGTIAQMKRVIELDGQHSGGLNYLAYTWAERGEKLDEALKLANRALAIKPDSGYITDTVAWIYYQMGDYPKALHFLKRATDLVKDDPIITEHLGDAYFKLKQYKEALRTYKRAKTLEPENEAALDKKIDKTKKLLGQ